MPQPLLILDLDETLVFATKQELATPPDFQVGPFHVHLRPHLARFLEDCFAQFEVAVWTSAGRDYASGVLARFPGPRDFRFFWSAERCTQRTNRDTRDLYTVKDLGKVRKLGYRLEQVLMVDDSPEKLERHYGNLIRIRPFEGDPADQELPALTGYLRTIRDHPNYRTIEKRFWRAAPGGGAEPASVCLPPPP